MMEIYRIQFHMKSSTNKDIVVKINGIKNVVTIDSSIFDDIFIEAATRVVEKYKPTPSFFNKIRIIGECYEKKNEIYYDKHYQVNMYHIIINAGLHSLAELLRQKTIDLHKIDLQLEPIRSNARKSDI